MTHFNGIGGPKIPHGALGATRAANPHTTATSPAASQNIYEKVTGGLGLNFKGTASTGLSNRPQVSEGMSSRAKNAASQFAETVAKNPKDARLIIAALNS